MAALATAVRTAARLTTPLLPTDYLALANPLWGRAPRGRVEAVHRESRHGAIPDAATLTVRPGPGWPGHRAGQYVRIGVDLDGVRHWRSYSLTSPSGRADRFTVTVAAQPGGRVSSHLVRVAAAGDVLHLAAPTGGFVLPEPLPPRALFLTAGSGVTPVVGMLRSHRLPDAVHVHLARSPRAALFGAELRARRSPTYALHEWYSSERGRFALDRLAELCPDWADRPAWVCGPGPLLDAAEQHWARAGQAGRLHVERFAPPTVAVAGRGGSVTFARAGRAVAADGATPLLAVGEQAGVLMPSGCRMGICHGCVVPLRAGRVRDLRTGRVHGEPDDLVQTCVSAAAGPVELDL